MIKMVNMLVREDDYTHEEFVEYWLNDHAELAEQLPGLQKYVTSTPTDPEQSKFDGVLELYFEDMAALGAAFDSEIGQEVMADAESFIKMEEGPQVIVEETVQLDDTQ
ncbi:EthD family reductase [Halorussus halophilus]|uniref:EthD family reductase n=1 Tax=Halorussus halophilus TaxID=2650975 RepID=UPI001300F732|nr:EthD family reductase [Halorussus halophilus]